MADQFWGVSRGNGISPSGVTADTSTTSKEIELRVTSGTGITKAELVLALDAIKARVLKDSALT